ncbi:MAG: universal stress protein [Elusimicrobiota bacterium]
MYRFPPKKILVACDLSAPAAAAWRQAVTIAERFSTGLETVHVREWTRAAELASFPAPDLSSAEESELRARIRETIGADAKTTILSGDAALGILRAARAVRADLIVVGTHGRTRLQRMLRGSVAEAVAHRSKVPVLVVHGAGEAIRSILAPVNFTANSDHGFAYAAALAEGLGAELAALHVRLDPIWGAHPERKIRRLLDALPGGSRAACRTIVETGHNEAAPGILKAGAAFDLVALVAREHSRLKDMVLGTTAERVLRGSTASVLVVPASRASAPRKKLPLAGGAAIR